MKDTLGKKVKNAVRMANIMLSLLFVGIFGVIFVQFYPDLLGSDQKMEALTENEIEVDRDEIIDGVHTRTGLLDAEGVMLVVYNCTNCHSAKLVTQNRMNTERWNETIKWMQETQGLWDLGDNQEVIVNYLVTNYPPKKSNGRRATLTNIEWYDLED